eukprot:CAMPEP_0201593380 /NCGR_PEP_ID=MMETSP0190_2-20130828/190999_1 /ASSEMBLY_ACC=CAM_ASM_000263 /TAXON_ID=37353 /ORGANISM="Rosalina sp." /LENGTH=169 /DNA_ID=CAMNT_0048052539 /DNA_START=472 /DNA_END=978 /DNA_ORIENTATION=+
MSRVFKITGAIFGVYTGLLSLSIGSHWINPFHKKFSYKVPDNDATKPLTPSQLNDLDQRKDIEQKVINMFNMKATQPDLDIVDDNCLFADPSGSRKGKSAIGTIIFALPNIIHDHKMKDIEIERYSNAFTLKFDQSARAFGITLNSLETIVYVELNEDNTRVTKIYDYW